MLPGATGYVEMPAAAGFEGAPGRFVCVRWSGAGRTWFRV